MVRALRIRAPARFTADAVAADGGHRAAVAPFHLRQTAPYYFRPIYIRHRSG
jgi:hypothetical protein